MRLNESEKTASKMKCDSCVVWCAVKCKETFLRKDTFQIWYRCRGGGGGAMRGTLSLISPDRMEYFLRWRGNCRGPKVATSVEILKQQKQRKVTSVWTFGRILHMSPQRCQPVARVLLQIDNYFKSPTLILKIKGTLLQMIFKLESTSSSCQNLEKLNVKQLICPKIQKYL